MEDQNDHDATCESCEELNITLMEIADAVRSAPPTSRDDIDDFTFTVDMAIQDITAFKAHQLRHINQDKARINILQQVDGERMVFIQDWAMKFLPKKYRESQTQWLPNEEFHGTSQQLYV